MIGVVIVSHGKLAEEFVKVAEHVMGPQDNLLAIAIDPDEEMEVCRERVLKAIQDTDRGNGVIVLTDMFGGTPSNIALSLLKKAKIEIIAGFNLPLLIKLLSVRKTKPIGDAVVQSQEAGQKYIHVASQIMNKDPKASNE